MTAQIHEIIIYEGREYDMATEPLYTYLKNNKEDIPAVRPYSLNTACWRGYIGTWEVKNEKLYLIDINELVDENGEKAGVDSFFPGQKEIFAEWFTGEIRIPDGELLQYEHMGYMSVYERDIKLYFNKGVLLHEETINNKSL